MIGLFKGNKEKGPNIVILMIDQFRNDMREGLPSFAELAKRGVTFSQMISYAPYTLASLHATFTGMYGRLNGVDGYTKSDRFDAKNCMTLPQYLQKCGYHTRGYTFSSIVIPHSGFDKLDIVPEAEEKDVLGSHQRALRECFEDKKRPFFAFLHYGDIHHEVVREVIKKYTDYDDRFFGLIDQNRQRYQAYVKDADRYLTEMIRSIDQWDVDRNTLLVVFTDHGGGLGEKPGEKAYGIFTYDYSICAWLYLICPDKLPQGLEIPHQVRSIDLLPTLIEFIGLPASKKHKPILGRSLMGLIRGSENEDRPAFSETGGVDGPIPSPNAPNVHSVRSKGWKLIYNSTTNQFELYDLKNDVGENKNLYTTRQDVASDLWKTMIEYL